MSIGELSNLYSVPNVKIATSSINKIHINDVTATDFSVCPTSACATSAGILFCLAVDTSGEGSILRYIERVGAKY